jgi:hypothetical protein
MKLRFMWAAAGAIIITSAQSRADPAIDAIATGAIALGVVVYGANLAFTVHDVSMAASVPSV